MKGLFITFEGIDGAGKSTQLRLAAQALRAQGYEVVETREPGGTVLAERVRELVLDATLPMTATTQTLLYLAARSEHVDKLIRPALEAGKLVLCDRFSDSTLVYQGLAQGQSLAEVDKLRRLNGFACNELVADLTLLFDGRPQALLQRRQARGVSDRYELQGLDFQERLREGFLTIAKAEPQRVCVIAAEAVQEAVQAEVMQRLETLLHEAK